MRQNPRDDKLLVVRQIAAILERAVAEERAACAAIAEAVESSAGRDIAAQIRARDDRAQPALAVSDRLSAKGKAVLLQISALLRDSL